MVAIKTPVGVEKYKYSAAYDSCIVYNKLRNKTIVDWVMSKRFKNQQVLVIVWRIAHGEYLELMLKEQGESSVGFLCGQTPKARRDELMNKFRKGKLRVLVSNVIKEGIDIPAISGLVIANGWKSYKQNLQRKVKSYLKLKKQMIKKTFYLNMTMMKLKGLAN